MFTACKHGGLRGGPGAAGTVRLKPWRCEQREHALSLEARSLRAGVGGPASSEGSGETPSFPLQLPVAPGCPQLAAPSLQTLSVFPQTSYWGGRPLPLPSL